MTALAIDLDDRAWFDAIPVGGIGVHVVEGVRIVDSDTGEFKFMRPPPEWVALSEQRCETFRPVCNRIGPNFGKPDHKGCSDCLGSGRPLVQVTVPCETCKTFGDPDDYEDGWCMWVVETTDGDPTKIVQVHSEHGWRQVSYAPDWNSNPCPDCHGSGRPLVPVTVPCRYCLGSGRVLYDEDTPGAGQIKPHYIRCPGWNKKPDIPSCEGAGRLSIGYVTVEGPPVPIVRYDEHAIVGRYIVVGVREDSPRAFLMDNTTLPVSSDDVDLGPNPEQHVGKWAVIVRRVS